MWKYATFQSLNITRDQWFLFFNQKKIYCTYAFNKKCCKQNNYATIELELESSLEYHQILFQEKIPMCFNKNIWDFWKRQPLKYLNEILSFIYVLKIRYSWFFFSWLLFVFYKFIVNYVLHENSEWVFWRRFIAKINVWTTVA